MLLPIAGLSSYRCWPGGLQLPAYCVHSYSILIPVLQKIGARFALWRIKIDPDKCIDCGLCEKHCPMDIKLLAYKEAGQRVLSTECILCHTCADICPEGVISSNMKQLDMVREERLRYRDE